MPRLTDAQQQLCRDNMRLAWWVVNRYVPKRCRHLLSDEDWEQEAMYCLSLAASQYQPERGRFSTYATVCLRRHLARLLDKLLHGQGGFERRIRLVHNQDDLEQHSGNAQHGSVCDAVSLDGIVSDGTVRWSVICRILGGRDSAILRERIEQGRTLKEIGRRYGVSRQRIRQIVTRSTAKLRRYLRSYQLQRHAKNKQYVAISAGNIHS